MNSPVILHVSTAHSWRGGEQQLAYLVGELKSLKVAQYILCVNGSAVESFCIHNHIPYFSTAKRSSVDVFFARKIASVCKKNNINIIHVHDSHAHTFAILANDIFRNDVSIIVSRRVDFPIGKSFLSKYKYNHRKVKNILCVSEKIREIATAALNVPERAITVHSGIDLSRFNGKEDKRILHDEYKLEESKKIIANISAIAPHKDYFTFVDTAAILCRKRDDICFFIIGDGPMFDEVKNYVKDSGFASRIIMTGFRNDIPDILPELDIFLITSETEGLGTTIIDAFACKVPVVATRAGGIPELVIHEKTGLLSPVKDSVVLASNVERYLDNAALVSDIIQNSTEHARSFTTKITAEKTLDCYTGVLS
jgi:L-malate glycosyltransferase